MCRCQIYLQAFDLKKQLSLAGTMANALCTGKTSHCRRPEEDKVIWGPWTQYLNEVGTLCQTLTPHYPKPICKHAVEHTKSIGAGWITFHTLFKDLKILGCSGAFVSTHEKTISVSKCVCSFSCSWCSLDLMSTDHSLQNDHITVSLLALPCKVALSGRLDFAIHIRLLITCSCCRQAWLLAI